MADSIAAERWVHTFGCGHATSPVEEMYPRIGGFVGDRWAELSGTAFSIVMVMALTGGMILPWLTGVLGASYGLRGSFAIVPVALILLSLLLGIVAARLRASARPVAADR
jgi:fucose permease